MRFKAKYGYAGGYLSSVQDYTGNVNGPVLWSLNLMDARFNATSESYGNTLWLQNSFDSLTGAPLTRQSGTGGQASNVQNLGYAWDTAGNLTSRTDQRQGLTESFSYDALDRLTQASGPGTQSLTLTFDAIGNITSKSDVGSYSYGSSKVHAVTSAGGRAYAYDANGNLISRGGATVTWSRGNYPLSIGDPSGYSAQFDYAPDGSRWRQASSYAGGTETTIYVGGLLEKLTTPARTHWKYLIATPSGQVQVIRRSDGTTETLYLATDALGSTDVVMSGSTVLARESFAAYGARRSSSWVGAPSPSEWQSIANSTRRGYTGHEQLDNLLLIHMNGRVYDPRLGRFVSADPYVDGADGTQGWNRYSYVHNGPLSAVDPSGFIGINGLEEVLVTARRFGVMISMGLGLGVGQGGAAEPREPRLPEDEVELTVVVEASRLPSDAAAGMMVVVQGQGQEQQSPESKPTSRQQCLENRYGVWAEIAADLSYLSLPALVHEVVVAEVEEALGDAGTRQANRLLNSGQYYAGKRMRSLVGALKVAGKATGVAGSFATGLQLGMEAQCLWLEN